MYQFPDDSDSSTCFAFLDGYWARRIRRSSASPATSDSDGPRPDLDDISADALDARPAKIVACRQEERDAQKGA